MKSLNTIFKVAAFFEMTPDLVCIAGKDGYFKEVNRAVVEKLGYTKEELFAKPISTFIHPDDRPVTLERRAALFNGNSLLNFENRYVNKNGHAVWLEWTSSYFAEQEIVFAIAKDITARKNAEKEVEEKYRNFIHSVSDFKSQVEEDRKLIAVELHEELAQLASLVKMNLGWVQMNESALSELTKNRIEHTIAISDLLIHSIRRISFTLHPSMLDNPDIINT